MAKRLVAAGLIVACLLGAQASMAGELRGAWLHGRECRTPETADRMLDRAETLNLNALFVLVFAHRGHAVYRSDMVPMMEGVEEGFDPLGYLVDEGHKRDIQIHAWFVNGSYGWGPTGAGILDEKPEWRAMDLRGLRTDWYDLCQPDVREWQARAMCEVVERYDVDGVHFDYIRFNNKSVCVCPACARNASAEVGLDVGEFDYAELPAFGGLSGNPVAEPTTALVLAEFDDGVPAIALNRLGDGRVLLLNWHADRWCPKAVMTAVRNALASAGVEQGDRVFLLDSDVNAPRYGRNFWSRRPWVQALGYRVEKTTDEGLGSLPSGSTVFMVGFYMMTEPIAASLVEHVRRGGVAVFVDAPIFAVKHPSARTLLGFAKAGRYFNGKRALLSTGADDAVVPRSERPFSVEDERAKHARWDAWRKERVTKLVADVSARARAIRPDVQVTAAVFYNEPGAEGVLQDWPRWLREGYLDYVIPMSYVKTPEALDAAFAWWRTIDPALERIIPAVGAWDIAADAATPERAAAIAEQVAVCRRQRANGVCMFVLNNLDEDLCAALSPLAFPGKAEPYVPPRKP